MLVSSDRRLFSDMTVRCADPQSLQWILGVGVPMLVVFVVGVPLVLLVILRRNFSEGECSKESRLTYGFLFAECTSGCRGCMSWVRLDMPLGVYSRLVWNADRSSKYLWELWVMSRKALVAGAIVLLNGWPHLQVNTVLALVVLMLSLHLHHRPQTNVRLYVAGRHLDHPFVAMFSHESVCMACGCAGTMLSCWH